MATIYRYKTKYIDYIRMLLNDKTKAMFDDDELTSMIDRFRHYQETVLDVTCRDLRYQVDCCSCDRGPLYNLVVSDDELDLAVYVIDEWAGVVYFDADDPENTAVAPLDGTQIEVTYYKVDLNNLMSELYWILSNNAVKLAVIASMPGLNLNTSELHKMFWEQSLKWKSEGGCV